MQTLAGLRHPDLFVGGLQRVHLTLALVGHDMGLRQTETAFPLPCHHRDIPAAFQLALFYPALQLYAPADIIAATPGGRRLLRRHIETELNIAALLGGLAKGPLVNLPENVFHGLAVLAAAAFPATDTA